jgi:diacylglycerol kinase (ATP)
MRIKKEYKKKKNIIKSFGYALRGLGFAFYYQKHMKVHLIITILITILGLLFAISKFEWMALLLSITLVLFAEIINTALEISVDLTTKKTKLRAMLAKDLAAGAVLITSINAILIGCFIFGTRLI